MPATQLASVLSPAALIFMALIAVTSASLPSAAAAAEEILYEYDERSRLTRIVSNGTEIVFSYDDAGNRIAVVASEAQGVAPLAVDVPEPGGAASVAAEAPELRGVARLAVAVLLLSLLATLLALRLWRSGALSTRSRISGIGISAVRQPVWKSRVVSLLLVGAGLLMGLVGLWAQPSGAQTEAPPGFEVVDPAFWLEGDGSPSAMAATAAEPGTALVATFPGSATEITPEIAALARALRHDVDLIYEFVAAEIDYSLIWGSHKGALGTLLDRKGGDFDQASLMIALLRASGYEATYP